MLSPLDIRRAAPGDLRGILAVERQCFGPDAWDEASFLAYLRHCPDLFLAARDGPRLAGYSITCARSADAELVSIGIAPRSRRSGLGAYLMAGTLGLLRAQGVRRWLLTVRVSNDPAIRFYLRFGFERTRRVARYYEDGEPGWRMELRLP